MTPARTVVLYGRPDCHLCEEARALLVKLAAEYRFTLREVDITADRDAYLRFWSTIPVVAVGESLVPAALDEERVRSVLDWEFRDDTARPG